MKISTQPYKGARDFYPEDMRVRNYIFSVWKEACKRYAFEEYDFPIVESFEVFAAKSGEEIVNTQLFSFEDKGGRKLALRPELTPSTVRMIAEKYGQLIKPLKWFMIGNNWRFEKPQKGRGREFYQLEANIFGAAGIEADLEILLLIVNIMKAFGANENQFRVYLSDRRLITALLNDTMALSQEQQIAVRRLMDRRKKMAKEEFFGELGLLKLNDEQCEKVEEFMNADLTNLGNVLSQQAVENNLGYKNMLLLFKMMEDNGIAKYCEFNPSIIRGFDYSDGLVYEVFDSNPENRRSMFGGERFDKLVSVYGDMDLAATGFAMGDITLLEFLKGWNLLPELPIEIDAAVVVFNNDLETTVKVSEKLRNLGLRIDSSLLIEKMDKQMKYFDRKGIQWVVIPGEEEMKEGKVTLKNLKERTQEQVKIEEVAIKIRG